MTPCYYIFKEGGSVSKFEKLLQRIKNLDNGLRFEELKKILESLGYEMNSPRGGSSHFTFRKKGHIPITIPKHEPIKTAYVRLVKEAIEETECK